MKNKFYHFFSIIMAFSLSLSAQPDEYKPDPQSVLQLIRKEKIKHVLPLAMRNNNVDMWIHVTRAGDPDPLEYEFGSTSGYLIFTDLGDRIEVVDNNPDRDGKDTLNNVENGKFVDRIVSFSDKNIH